MGIVFLFGVFVLGTLAMVWIFLPLQLGSLRRRLVDVDGVAAKARRTEEEIAALMRRVAALEAGASPSIMPTAVAVPPAVAVPAAPPAPQPFEREPVTSAPQPPPAERAPAPVSRPAPIPAPSAPPAPPSVAPPMPRPVVKPQPAAAAMSASAAESARPAETWEVVVGTNWLNKIGVVVFVIGVALLVGYSMVHVGPLGRVAIGYALSLGMLGSGVALERRDAYRNYAHGLVAGGWAGVYFTTYAMHAVDAARIVESPLAGGAALLLVAAGMIAHSLRYRSQTVTGLAYVTAYATLLMTPVTGFSLAASVPLAASLVVVSQRFGWMGVSIVGLVSTYGLFALRAAIFPDSIETSGLTSIGALAAYWILFEVADVIGLKSRASAALQEAPLFILNGLGLVGAGLLDPRMTDPIVLARFTAFTGLAYLASATARAWLAGGSSDTREPDGEVAFGTTHGAVAAAAALAAWSIALRFTGHRETLALLFETQMMLVAGVLLKDRHIRTMASVVAALVTLHHWSFVAGASQSAISWPWAMRASTPISVLIAVTWYANREWLRAKAARPIGFEHLYTWTALAMTGLAIGHEVAPAYQGIAAIGLAAALLEAGLRRAPEYRFQAYVAGLAGAWSTFLQFAFQSQGTSLQDVWLVLLASAVLFYFFAWRLTGAARHSGADDDMVSAAGAAALLGTLFVTTLEWRVASRVALGPVWAATAVALASFGLWRRLAGLRWQGYLLAFASTAVAVTPLIVRPAESRAETVAVAAAIALAYVVAFVGRFGRAKESPATAARTADAEGAVLLMLPAFATAALALYEWRVVPSRVVGFVWSVKATVLLALGLWRAAVDLRLQAYLVFAAAAVRTLHTISGPDSPDSNVVLWAGATIALFYIASLASKRGYERLDANDFDARCRQAVALGATLLLTLLLIDQVRPTLITLAWGLEGALLLGVGFPLRERVLRLSGLTLLLLCVLKLFVFDLSELEALARILSFVVLGLVLLAVSWTYTRYREQIRKLL